MPLNAPLLRHIPALVACAAVAMASPASAQVFSDLDTDHTWHIGGRLWVRTFPDESGWWVPLSDTEDYVLWHVDDDLVLDWTDGIDLTGRDDLTDHGMSGDSFQLSVLDELLNVTEILSLDSPAMSTGSSLRAELDTDTLLVVHGIHNSWDGGIHMRRYTPDLELLEDKPLQVPLPSEDHAPYWPQGLLRVGDHYLVAYVVGTRDAVDMYGDIQLTAFDADFEEVETITVIKQGDLEWGFMRPWISCREDQVVVSFDHNNDQVTFLASVTLDLEALGVDTSGADPASYGDCAWPLPGDPGADDEDDEDDEDDDTDGPHLTPPAADDCACRAPSAAASAGPTMLLLVTLMAAAVARLTRRI
jgi:hypothetical protein